MLLESQKSPMIGIEHRSYAPLQSNEGIFKMESFGLIDQSMLKLVKNKFN